MRFQLDPNLKPTEIQPPATEQRTPAVLARKPSHPRVADACPPCRIPKCPINVVVRTHCARIEQKADCFDSFDRTCVPLDSA
jgi:hypothetical protein